MPGRQQPTPRVESTTPRQPTCLKLPSQSSDTVYPHGLRSPSPFVEPSNKRPGKRHKSVRWASSVVDNEPKMQSRPGTPPKVRTSTKNPPLPVRSGTKPSTSRPPTANTPIKIVPSSPRYNSPKIVICAPPMVPDPPKSPGPPPAPRPRRLPTPDLPEIEESKFFIPKENIPGYPRSNRHSKDRPTHLHYEDKTDVQMAAAKAYMQERNRRN